MSERAAPTSAADEALRAQFGDQHREFHEIMYALNAYSIVAITDRRGFILHVNDRFCEISKYARHELIGQSHRIINSGRHPKEFFKDMWRHIGRGEVWKQEICNRAKDGTEYWVDTTIIPLLDDRGRPERYVAIRTEETQRHLAEDEVRRLAFSDSITGLPNKAAMLRKISSAIEECPPGEFSCVIVVSVDDLSVVNDAFGYEVGDRLLVDAGERIGGVVQSGMQFARIGSNDFALLLSGLGSDEHSAQQRVSEIVEEVFDAYSMPISLGSDVVVSASTSIGYVLWADPGSHGRASAAAEDCFSRSVADGYIETDDPREIVKSADIARKRARRAGGQRRVRYFRQSMLEEAKHRVRLVSELRRGIDRGELRLYSQPIVDCDRRVIGEEGLIRWQSPERGLVSPAEFIPLAEQTGIIIEIGQWVIEEACKVLARWSADPDRRGRTFAVNLSERQLRMPGFGEQVRSILQKYDLNPNGLKLEITESALQSDLDRTIKLLSMLRAEGVASSLDDFGTGYSSLSYLQQLPVQQLKIDRSFVSAIIDDESANAITQTIVQLGRTFGLQIVAEGVETEAQFDRLRELGVDAFQGYLFSRPRPVDETD